MGFKENIKKAMKKRGKGGKVNKGMSLPELQAAARAAKGKGKGAPVPEGEGMPFPPRR